MEDHTEINITRPGECLSCGAQFKDEEDLLEINFSEIPKGRPSRNPEPTGQSAWRELWQGAAPPAGKCPKCGDANVHNTEEEQQLALFEQMKKPRDLTWFDLG